MTCPLGDLQGSMVALATPMHPDGALDFDRLASLIEWHIAEGSDCLVVTGTTGESPTLDHAEHVEVIAKAVEFSRGRVPIIAGTGSNSTREAIDLSRRALELGVDACLQVAPYYNRPPQAGLRAHFAEIAREAPGRHILYNVPARTGSDVLPETVARLAQIENIVGIKEATGSVERAAQVREALAKARPDFRLYAGDDAIALGVIECGGQGCISVSANVVPRQLHQVYAAAVSGDLASARQLNEPLSDLHEALFVQANPIPVKWALAKMGKFGPGLRLPLVELESEFHPKVTAALERAGVQFTSA